MGDTAAVKRLKRRDQRPIRIEGDVAYVTLTKGLVAVIDAADVGLVGAMNWQAVPKNGLYYAGRKETVAPNVTAHVFLHRLIMGAGPGDPLVEHRDRDTMNCCRFNLRFATQSINIQNGSKWSGASTPYRGVSFCPRPGRRRHYQARINQGGKAHHLGMHMTAEEGAQAYDAKALELYGPDANLNF